METINGCTVVTPVEDTEPFHFAPPDTNGAYVAVIGEFPPRQPPPPVHVHPNTDEAFYIAAGEATFLLGDRELPVTSGGFVFVPRGVAHTVWNSGDDALRGLLVISPGDSVHEFVPVENA